jgi:hypothetical protein
VVVDAQVVGFWESAFYDLARYAVRSGVKKVRRSI